MRAGRRCGAPVPPFVQDRGWLAWVGTCWPARVQVPLAPLPSCAVLMHAPTPSPVPGAHPCTRMCRCAHLGELGLSPAAAGMHAHMRTRA